MNTAQQKDTRIPVAILGATGMVGQRLLTLLKDHPWFEPVVLAASARSAGKTYEEALEGRWKMPQALPPVFGGMRMLRLDEDKKEIASRVRLAFCAINADKEFIRTLEEEYAVLDVVLVSNNSAHRSTRDVPMIIPEINPHHLALIETQRKTHGWHKGLIVVKPNCSIQSYVPLLTAWHSLMPEAAYVTTFQALSGAGKTLSSWPEMEDNVIPLIQGEEEKSEKEPHKIWGEIVDGKIVPSTTPIISASCVRVPISDGHLATIAVKFKKETSMEELKTLLCSYENPIASLNLPSAPIPFITYFEEEDRPQTRLDRMQGNGMGISVGRLRKDPLFGYSCVALSHNTLRGAAGGSVLTAELLRAKGYLE